MLTALKKSPRNVWRGSIVTKYNVRYLFMFPNPICTANKYLTAPIQPITLECFRRSFINFPVLPNITVIAAWGKFLSHKLVRRLGDEVRRKNGEPTVGFSFTTMLQHICRFWSRISWQRAKWPTGASPILSWPGCSWCVPVSSTETSTEGRCFCGITDIINNATEELKRLFQNCFQECFQDLYSRWQNCIVARGDYLEGNIA